MEVVFPMLKKMSASTLQTISPVIVETLAHAGLEELSITRGAEETIGRRSLNSHPIPLIGEPDSLGRLFSHSFPQLTSLVFKKLMMGNKRTESILQNLRKHKHLNSIRYKIRFGSATIRSIQYVLNGETWPMISFKLYQCKRVPTFHSSIIDCYTDEELDPLADEINAENRMKITLQHNERQRRLNVNLSTDLLDAICNRTSVCDLTLTELEKDDMCFPDLHDKEVDSKVSEMPLLLRMISFFRGWRGGGG
nr:uncharacterized protein LOC129267873 [Lytechinus pictus]